MARPTVIAQQRVALRDPQDCTDQADDLALLEAVFDALVRRDVEGRYRPALAEHWSLSADARTWTFRLRPGLTFHDGAPLDAVAAKFSIERMQRPDVGATLGAPAVWGQYLADAVVEAPDPVTVRVTTSAPTADLLDVLVSGYVLPPDLADRPDFLAAPVGSGAYKVETAAAGEIRLRANLAWHGGAVANPDLIFRAVPDQAARAAAVPSGDAEVATRLAPGAGAAYLDPVAIIFLFNCAAGPLRDPRVRLALNLAIDRATLIDDVLPGGARPLTGFVSPAHVGADTPGDAYFDRDRARSLLNAAGHGDGLTLRIDRPTTLPDEAAPLTAAVARQLAEVGVGADVRVHADRVAYAERVRAKGVGDMCLFDSSPMSIFRIVNEKLDSRQPGAWHQGYANADVERLLDRSRRTAESPAREALHRDIYRTLRADPPWLFLYNRLRGVALAGDPGGWRMRNDGVLDVATLPKL